MATLRDRFDPRRNSLDALRLAFAMLVAVAHGTVIHTGSQPQWGTSTLGDFGLDGFFMLSGFLVPRSFLALSSFPRFAWHRFLRIMPGFWVCLIMIGLLVAPLAAILQGLPPETAFTGDPSALRYVAGNAALLITQYDIAGILAATPNGVSFNGSLWTLVFEAGCYGLVALLGALGLLRRRPGVVLALAGALAVLTALQEAGVPGLMNERLLRLTFVFVLGMLAFLYADRIPMRVELAAICAVVFLVSVMLFEDYRVLGAIPLAYVFFWFAVRFPWQWTMRADLSYGLYIFHWPVLQLLVVAGPGSLATPVFIAAGLAVTAILAAFSWYWVEKPALGRKHSELPDRIAALVLRRPADLASTGAHRRLGDQPSREDSVGLVVASSDPGDVPVTRIEVLDFVAEAFDAVPVRPRSLVEVAIGNGARDAVLEVLCRLPDVELRESAQLWDHLDEVAESLPRSR